MIPRCLPALAAVVVATLGGPGAADACSCLRSATPCQASASAIVFVGEVLSVEERGDRIEMRVRVSRGLEGVETGRIVTVESDVSSCGVRLREGQRYQIFSHGVADRIVIGACMLPLDLLPGEPDPEFPAAARRVYGRVSRSAPARAGSAGSPGPDGRVGSARVWIDAPNGRLATTTDPWGRFTFSNVRPGTYRLGVDGGPDLEPYSARLDVKAGALCTDTFVRLEASPVRPRR